MPELASKSLRGLYAITPDGIDKDVLLARTEALLRGGVRLVQYRDKTSNTARRAEIASALCALCRQYGASFIVNDDLALALAVDADGVHLGANDGDLEAARLALGADKLLGASCYADFKLARAAVRAGVDYLAFGAVFSSPTKPHAAQAPLSLFARSRHEFDIPVCAIGGITLDNAPALVAAGADLLAVITDLYEAPDIELRAMAFQKLFEGERN